MQPTLFDFQDVGITNISDLFRKGFRKVLAVGPGGMGKTIVSAAKTQRFHQKQLQQYRNETRKKVAFFTHREELFDQTRDKFLRFGNITEPINASTDIINNNADTFVCMIETFKRRMSSESFLSFFSNVGLIFIDEAHRTDFDNVIHHFFDKNSFSLIQGWTATPISADKKTPLRSIWDVMIEIATTTQLQKLNAMDPSVGVVPCECYNLGKVDRDKLKVRGIDFNEKEMSSNFSNKLQVQNVLDSYFSLGDGMKGLCFNVDLDHNSIMHNEFVAAGIPSRELHSDKKRWFGAPSSSLMKNWRKDTIEWQKHTPKSIIHNVGILTTGYDEPSIELAMTNFSSLSLPKVVQCKVRAARTHFFKERNKWKEFYRWLDFGKNCSYFNTDGNNDLPWKFYFENPGEVKPKEGIASMKTCPNCGFLNAPAVRFCSGLKEDWLLSEYRICGYEFPLGENKEEDLIPRLMIKFFVDNIVVTDFIALSKKQGWKDGGLYFKILEAIAKMAKDKFGILLLEEHFDFILDISVKKMKELGKIIGKKYWKDFVKQGLIGKLREVGCVLDVEINIEILEENNDEDLQNRNS